MNSVEGAPVPATSTLPSGRGAGTATSSALILIAWVTTLLVSRLPEIVLRDISGRSVPWMPWAVVALSGGLVILTSLAPALRPLQRYFVVMTTLAILFAVIPLIFESQAWSALVPRDGHPIVILLAERLVLALLAIVVIGVVLLLGTRPADAYLRVGDVNAPTTSRKPRSTELLRWGTFGPLMLLFLAFITAWAAAPIVRGPIDVAAALPSLGLAAIAALLNAFWEEVAYRAAPLSQLQRAIGPSAGVLILAVWFGLGHYYGGIPSGPMGALLTGAVALLFGRAMIETRGLAWPLALHFIGDFVIYVFLALAATTVSG